MPSADSLPFFRAWLAAPFRVGAMFPSSEALAKAMTVEITSSCAP